LHPLVLPAVGLGVVLTLGGGLLASLRGGTVPPATSLAAAPGTQVRAQPSTTTSTFSRAGLAEPAVLSTPSPEPRASSPEPVSSAKRRRGVRPDGSAKALGAVSQPSVPPGLIEEPPF